MTTFKGFDQKDFDVFKIEGLEERMEALRSRISTKLEAIATELEPTVSSLSGDEMFVHVAKHARRTKNPPNDTWAALASSKRGYKMLPHFQVGMWETHVFVWFAVIYESPIKVGLAQQLKKNKEDILSHLSDDFVWSKDHMQPETISQEEIEKGGFDELVDRLENVKKAEILCGKTFDRKDPILKDGDKFLNECEHILKKVMPIYDLAKNVSPNQ